MHSASFWRIKSTEQCSFYSNIFISCIQCIKIDVIYKYIFLTQWYHSYRKKDNNINKVIFEAAQAEASPGRSQDLKKCWTANFSFPSHPFHNYSLLSIPTLPDRPSPSPHIFDSCLHHKMLLSVLIKQSFSLLLISFTLFTLRQDTTYFVLFFCRRFWYQIMPSVSVIIIRKGPSFHRTFHVSGELKPICHNGDYTPTLL